jgi:hypothetical protein
MARPRLSYLDYVRAAFHRKVAVPMLGTMPVNAMALGAFAVLGIANPGFWLLGAAAELAYLLGVSSNGRFQKLVDAEQALDAQSGWEERVHAEVERLAPDSRKRYAQLLDQCRRILGLSESTEGASLAGVRGLRSSSLNQLLWIFLRLLRSRELIRDNLHNVDRKALAAEAEATQKRLEALDREHSAALARSLEGTHEIQLRRLANLERAAASQGVIDAELGRIEQHVELIREESAVWGKPEALSERLDAVTGAMSETTRWMADNAELFSSLGGEEATPALRELPSLPASEEER